MLRDVFSIAQPPLLGEEGKFSNSSFGNTPFSTRSTLSRCVNARAEGLLLNAQ